jgi:hypothetical protein
MKKLVFSLSALALSLTISTNAYAANYGKDGIDKDCKHFKTQKLAQAYFIKDGGSKKNNVDNLDSDHDGIACEHLPKR